jgi:DNA repair photolyase
VRAARRTEVSVTFSIPTLDLDIWRRTEPETAPPHQRLRALRQLVEAGIRVGVGMAPILPGLSDRPELLEDVVRAARAAGATGVWANLLHLRPGTKEHYLAALERDWPELLPEYERLYGRKAYLDGADLRAQVRELARRHGVRDRRRIRLEPPESPEQLSLAV